MVQQNPLRSSWKHFSCNKCSQAVERGGLEAAPGPWTCNGDTFGTTEVPLRFIQVREVSSFEGGGEVMLHWDFTKSLG